MPLGGTTEVWGIVLGLLGPAPLRHGPDPYMNVRDRNGGLAPRYPMYSSDPQKPTRGPG